MFFNSILFLFLFLPFVLLVYYALREPYRISFLILANLLFYAYLDWKLALHFMAFILITYIISLWLRHSHYSRRVLGFGITALTLYLLYFKYMLFLGNSINQLVGTSIPVNQQIVAPLGISFYTFTAISYFVDSYRNKNSVPFFEYLNYMSFFPKIISGPLISIGEFSPTGLSAHRLNSGLSRFIIGLTKKVVFSYYFGSIADDIWKNLAFGIDSPTAWIGAIAYSLQLYYDFSGYSDMAIGLADMFGYSIGENFNFPYLSQSISEFWRRWHISLGKWFRDYIYIPLGGSRKGNSYINLFIVFLITGLWHGANWTFIVWGLWHGSIRMIEKTIEPSLFYRKIPGGLKWFMTTIAVIFGWVLFRSATFSEAWNYIQTMLGFSHHAESAITFTWAYFLNKRTIFYGVLGIFGATLFERTKLYYFWKSIDQRENVVHFTGQTLFLAGLLVFCLMMILSSKYVPFIYFQF